MSYYVVFSLLRRAKKFVIDFPATTALVAIKLQALEYDIIEAHACLSMTVGACEVKF